MNEPEPPMPQRRHLMLAAAGSVIATALVAVPFRGMAESCVEMGCLSLVLFYPLSAIAAALAALAIGAYAGRGCSGQVEGLFWAAVGWLATLFVIAAVFRP